MAVPRLESFTLSALVRVIVRWAVGGSRGGRAGRGLCVHKQHATPRRTTSQCSALRRVPALYTTTSAANSAIDAGSTRFSSPRNRAPVSSPRNRIDARMDDMTSLALGKMPGVYASTM